MTDERRRKLKQYYRGLIAQEPVGSSDWTLFQHILLLLDHGFSPRDIHNIRRN